MHADKPNLHIPRSPAILLRLLHIALAAQLLASTVGIASSAHFCMGELVDLRFFAKAKSCGMEVTPKLEASGQANVSKTPCCQDESTFHKYEPTKDQQLDQPLPSVAIAGLYIALPTAFAKTQPRSRAKASQPYYRPPPLERSRRLAMQQAYLI